MRGFWHIVAFAAVFAIVSVIIDVNLLFLLLLWLLYLFYSERIQVIVLVISVVIFFLLLQHLPQASDFEQPTSFNQTEKTIQGEIVRAPLITKQRIEFVIESQNNLGLSVVYFLDENESIPREVESLKSGAACILTGEIDIPEAPRNPGEFDFGRYLQTNGIQAQVIVSDFNEVFCEGTSIIGELQYFRQQLIQHTLYLLLNILKLPF